MIGLCRFRSLNCRAQCHRVPDVDQRLALVFKISFPGTKSTQIGLLTAEAGVSHLVRIKVGLEAHELLRQQKWMYTRPKILQLVLPMST